jgi:hypothetical protein
VDFRVFFSLFFFFLKAYGFRSLFISPGFRVKIAASFFIALIRDVAYGAGKLYIGRALLPPLIVLSPKPLLPSST